MHVVSITEECLGLSCLVWALMLSDRYEFYESCCFTYCSSKRMLEVVYSSIRVGGEVMWLADQTLLNEEVRWWTCAILYHCDSISPGNVRRGLILRLTT